MAKRAMKLEQKVLSLKESGIIYNKEKKSIYCTICYTSLAGDCFHANKHSDTSRHRRYQ